MSYINPQYQYWRPEETSSPSEDRTYLLSYYHSLLYQLTLYANTEREKKRITTLMEKLYEH